MEIYVHIPFCIKKCNYCDFLSMPADDTVKKQYVQALKNEIIYYAETYGKQNSEDTCVQTVYFGGGTPSVLQVEDLIEILHEIRMQYSVIPSAEITIEVNPATIDFNDLHKLRKAGFNRLSIGMQSTVDERLKLLGRIHNYQQFEETYEAARDAGFNNISIDCMSALPGQTEEEYTTGLHKVCELNPEHISSYSLILEEGTLFYENYVNHRELLPDEEADLSMYHMTKKILSEYGYKRYEISNYAKPGYESKHNSGYWKRESYLGFGLGASSFIDNRRVRNITDLKKYLSLWYLDANAEAKNDYKSVQLTDSERYEENDEVSKTDAMAEFFYLGLRMNKGISMKQFEQEFHNTVFQIYGNELVELEKQKLILINEEEDCIKLTDYGTDISNFVFSQFV